VVNVGYQLNSDEPMISVWWHWLLNQYANQPKIKPSALAVNHLGIKPRGIRHPHL
jgi:hypothetical protein